jgi:hypothetical protein
VCDRDVLETQLEGDDEEPEDYPEDGIENWVAAKGPELESGIADSRDEQNTREHEPRHDGLQGSGTTDR